MSKNAPQSLPPDAQSRPQPKNAHRGARQWHGEFGVPLGILGEPVMVPVKRPVVFVGEQQQPGREVAQYLIQDSRLERGLMCAFVFSTKNERDQVAQQQREGNLPEAGARVENGKRHQCDSGQMNCRSPQSGGIGLDHQSHKLGAGEPKAAAPLTQILFADVHSLVTITVTGLGQQPEAGHAWIRVESR